MRINKTNLLPVVDNNESSDSESAHHSPIDFGEKAVAFTSYIFLLPLVLEQLVQAFCILSTYNSFDYESMLLFLHSFLDSHTVCNGGYNKPINSVIVNSGIYAQKYSTYNEEQSTPNNRRHRRYVVRWQGTRYCASSSP